MSEKKKFIDELTTMMRSMDKLRRDIRQIENMIDRGEATGAYKDSLLIDAARCKMKYDKLDFKVESYLMKLKKHYLGDEFAEWYYEYYGFPYKNDSRE